MQNNSITNFVSFENIKFKPMKKTFFVLIIMLIMGFTVYSQTACDYYLPFQVGKGQAEQTYNAKNILTGSSEIKITDITTEGAYTVATVHSVSYDAKGKEQGQTDYKIKCNGNKLVFSSESFISPQTINAYKGMDMKIEAEDIEVPSNLSAGMTLPDGKLKMNVSQQGIQITEMTFEFTDRKVEAKQTLTVPAGTYDCFKITFDVNISTSTMGMAINNLTKNIQFYAKNVGVIRTETYDAKGKLLSYSVISKIL